MRFGKLQGMLNEDVVRQAGVPPAEGTASVARNA
jgi:hypothetical protein